MSTTTTILSSAQRRRLSPPRHRTPNYRLVGSHTLSGVVTLTWCAMPLAPRASETAEAELVAQHRANRIPEDHPAYERLVRLYGRVDPNRFRPVVSSEGTTP